MNFTGSSDVYALPHWPPRAAILFGSIALIHERNITSIFESKYTRINTVDLQRLHFSFDQIFEQILTNLQRLAALAAKKAGTKTNPNSESRGVLVTVFDTWQNQLL